MTWARLDDGMWCHPKFIGVSLGAVGLWTKVLSWCAKNLTNGEIKKGLPELLDGTQAQVDELVGAGLWDVVESGWSVHDYLEFNPSKEEVIEHRSDIRKRVSKHRDRRKRKERSDSNSVTDALRNGVGNAPPDPDPVSSSLSLPSELSAAVALFPDPTVVAASKGRTRLRAVDELQLDYDHRGKHAHALSVLASKPEEEWRTAAAVIKSELQKGNRRYLTPQGIVDNWHRYSIGEVPGLKAPTKVEPPKPTGIWAKRAEAAE